MKHFLLLLGIVLMVSGQAWAQRTFILSTLRHKTFASVTASSGRPTVSPFGKNTQNFLGKGQSLQVSVGHRLGWHWGIVGSYMYSTNPIRKNDVQNDLLRLVRVNVEQSAPWQSTATNCTLQSAMVGPMFTLQAGRFVFDIQATAGYAQGTSSDMEFNAQYQQEAISYTTPARTILAPAAGAGIAIRYKIFRWLALHGSAQYVTADLRYDNLYQEVKVGRQSSLELIRPHQPVGLLNVGGGLSFLF
ncbi:hypothetical protein [Salmonirosea aquatica]|uniref:Outer membrane beta-barrel protein n=1 Tax=Salmonirosea aquatica TaxID=2654236 RepID=A0A7C9BBE6_9BACT|nr:hypothetical protein [Cytophagaceae bacterium SJW1-29]